MMMMMMFSVYLKIAGVCSLVQVGSSALFVLFAGLHCAMQINNKKIVIKFSTNVFLAFLSAIVAGDDNKSTTPLDKSTNDSFPIRIMM